MLIITSIFLFTVSKSLLGTFFTRSMILFILLDEMVADEGYTMVRADELTADDLTGARVYDSTDQWIGEVSELLMDGSSKIDRAVVDVGGFLGIGEKPVALASDELNIQRENDGDDIRVRVNMTKEQLESLPEYED